MTGRVSWHVSDWCVHFDMDVFTLLLSSLFATETSYLVSVAVVALYKMKQYSVAELKIELKTRLGRKIERKIWLKIIPVFFLN